MQLIGSINSKSKNIVGKLNPIEKDIEEQSGSGNEEIDPNKDIVLELSVEMDGSSKDDDGYRENESINNLEQTIIIGEMREGNIFDDIKMNRDSIPTDPN